MTEKKKPRKTKESIRKMFEAFLADPYSFTPKEAEALQEAAEKILSGHRGWS
jgi:hypothetical protein